MAEQNVPTIFDRCQPDGGCQVSFAAAGAADEDQVGTLVDQVVSSANREDTPSG